MKNIFFVLICTFSLGKTQVVEDLSPTILDLKKVETLFVQELNNYRVSLGVNPLQQNDRFYYVAENQVDFLIKLNTEINRVTDSVCQKMLIGHEQKEEYEFESKKITFKKSEIKENIYDRFGKVDYKKIFHIGENIHSTYYCVECWSSSNYQITELELAKEWLESFKKSKMHDKNQTNSDYKEVTCCMKKMPWFIKDDFDIVIETELYFMVVVFTNIE